MMSLILFPILVFSQSFPIKPNVPVFNVNGEAVVRVDCWGFEGDFTTHYLNQTQHPKIFRKTIYSNGENIFTLEVSLLRSENTLSIVQRSEGFPSVKIVTYGLDCGFEMDEKNLYCSIFDGEIDENLASR